MIDLLFLSFVDSPSSRKWSHVSSPTPGQMPTANSPFQTRPFIKKWQHRRVDQCAMGQIACSSWWLVCQTGFLAQPRSTCQPQTLLASGKFDYLQGQGATSRRKTFSEKNSHATKKSLFILFWSSCLFCTEGQEAKATPQRAFQQKLWINTTSTEIESKKCFFCKPWGQEG